MAAPDIVVAYDDTWPVTIETLRSLVEPVLRGVRHEIEHVGSTAVPGLDAKPIVDFDVVVGSPADVPTALAALESAGWKHRGDLGIAGREAFDPVPTWSSTISTSSSKAIRRTVTMSTCATICALTPTTPGATPN